MHWYDVGGESRQIAVRPDDPETAYAASFAWEAVTRYDHRTGDQRTIFVWPEPSDGLGAATVRCRFNWSTPALLSPHDLHTLYVCGNHIFCSTDEGQHWQRVRLDLSRADGPITYGSAGSDSYRAQTPCYSRPRGLQFVPHWHRGHERATIPLRHPCASLFHARGVPARDIQAVLCHVQLAITMDLYTHVFAERKQEAAKAMDTAVQSISKPGERSNAKTRV